MIGADDAVGVALRAVLREVCGDRLDPATRRRPRRPSCWAGGWGYRRAPSRLPRPHRALVPVAVRACGVGGV